MSLVDPLSTVRMPGKREKLPFSGSLKPIVHNTHPHRPTEREIRGADPLPEKDTTFFFWLNGNNKTQGAAWSTLRLLEFVGSDENMNLVAQVSRPHHHVWDAARLKVPDALTGDKHGAFRYYVTRTNRPLDVSAALYESIHLYIPPYTKNVSSTVIKELGKTNMSNWKNFADAMLETMEKFPAKKFVVFMQGPASGLAGGIEDSVFKHNMTHQDIGQAFQYVKERTGKNVDLFVGNFSGSASLELFSELAGKVDYAWGTQTPVSGFGLAPLAALYELQRSYRAGFPRDPLEIARTFEEVAAASPASPTMTPTSSVIDLNRMPEVLQAVRDLKDNLNDLPKGTLRKLIEGTQEGGLVGDKEVFHQNRDAIHFAQRVVESPEVPDAARASAERFITVLRDALKGDAFRNKFYQNANGANMLLTTKYGHLRPEGTRPHGWDGKYHYEDTAFDKATGMHELLEKAAHGSVSDALLGKTISNTLVGLKRGKIDPKWQKLGGFGSIVGWWKSWDAWHGGVPGSFLGIPGPQAALLGGIGGVKNVWDGLKGIKAGLTKQKDRDFMYNQISDTLGGVAKTISNWGMIGSVLPFMTPLAPLAAPFGIAVFAKMWIDQIYGYYAQYKNTADNAIFSEFLKDVGKVATDQEARQRLGTALVNHIASHRKWD